MNVQFAVKDGEIYVLEVNPRASRTVPFVAKAIGAADRQDRGAGHGGREAGALPSKLDRNARFRTSRSRKRCSRSRASPASIRCSARR
jgi:hypothetical protein